MEIAAGLTNLVVLKAVAFSVLVQGSEQGEAVPGRY